jgi:imidazole glycerol-phosphate synthase subunit HisH
MWSRAERVVFPGQGAMPDCMRELDARGLREAVVQAAARSKPFLGICIGQQMLFEHSEEGNVPGIGILPGEVVRFPGGGVMVGADGYHLKVPHMGWNEVIADAISTPCGGHCRRPVASTSCTATMSCRRAALVAAETDYGLRFTSAVARDNIFAVQFHPKRARRQA